MTHNSRTTGKAYNPGAVIYSTISFKGGSDKKLRILLIALLFRLPPEKGDYTGEMLVLGQF
ncbi:MAG: hypothetical protein HQ553_17220 [Chloroflexi bacterium]|nr:hypothetical protein [Chloroflexota bacterium]